MKLFKTEKTPTHKITTILGIKFKSKRKDIFEIQREVSNMLNSFVDIRLCPKARGSLRELQLADTLLLKIFHNICEKHNMKYWLADGTLLGAIRHQGFIPWDDDLDLAISYDSYDEMVRILKEEFKNTDFILYGIDKTRFGNATLRITHREFEWLNLDIFYYHPSLLSNDDKEFIRKTREHYRKIYYKKYKTTIKPNENYEVLTKFRKELDIPFERDIKGCSLKEANSLVNQISSDFKVLNKDWIFPLIKHKFEDFEFYIPNNPHRVLEETYGDYMSFPPSVIHHGSMFSGFSEEQMKKINAYLKEILKEKFNEEY